jgi:hypothetical protein
MVLTVKLTNKNINRPEKMILNPRRLRVKRISLRTLVHIPSSNIEIRLKLNDVLTYDDSQD